MCCWVMRQGQGNVCTPLVNRSVSTLVTLLGFLGSWEVVRVAEIVDLLGTKKTNKKAHFSRLGSLFSASGKSLV